MSIKWWMLIFEDFGRNVKFKNEENRWKFNHTTYSPKRPALTATRAIAHVLYDFSEILPSISMYVTQYSINGTFVDHALL